MSFNNKSFLAKKIISPDGSSPWEEEHNVPLVGWCVAGIEPEEEANRRRSVLEHINNIVRAWIRSTMITEFRMPAEAAAQVEGRIFATGSYRYNVHASGSDIDIVLIAPNRITREHFFNTLAPRLQHEPRITELHCIRDARVPIIAMVADGIDIDLSFGSIRQDRVPEIITDDLLQGLDDQSVLSCNAVRVAHNIMDLVPHKASFRQALRFIKAWGKARGIYSNMFGFPSGIGWAILVAFVCQCHPNQNAAGMVVRFFRIYHAWFSPNPHESGKENRAIYLTETMRVRTNLGRCWDPRESKSDAMALFPVLTPAVPYSNACYNVTLTNLRQLCAEFARGHEICSTNIALSVEEAKSQFGQYGIWSKLLEPVKFFGEYKYYLHIQVSCTEAELYQGYVDAVESKIRFLWTGVAESRAQALENYRHVRLRLNPQRYEAPEEVEMRARILQKPPRGAGSLPDVSSQRHAAADSSTGPTSFSCHYFIGMTVDTRVSSGKIDLAPSIRSFHGVVRQLRQYKEGVTRLPVIKVVDISNIPAFVKNVAGYKEAVAPSDATTAESLATEPTTTATNNKENGNGNNRDGNVETIATSRKRPREMESLNTVDEAARKVPAVELMAVPSVKVNVVDSGVAKSMNAKGAVEETYGVNDDMDLEQALGLDF